MIPPQTTVNEEWKTWNSIAAKTAQSVICSLFLFASFYFLRFLLEIYSTTFQKKRKRKKGKKINVFSVQMPIITCIVWPFNLIFRNIRQVQWIWPLDSGWALRAYTLTFVYYGKRIENEKIILNVLNRKWADPFPAKYWATFSFLAKFKDAACCDNWPFNETICIPSLAFFISFALHLQMQEIK